VHGTIASEVAFLGVPSISCGDNPHIGFDFCRVARSKKEYRELLRSVDRASFDAQTLREQACVFHYMHNLNLNDAAIALRDEAVSIRTSLIEMFPLQEHQVAGVAAKWRAMSELGEFKRYMQELYGQVRPDKENHKPIQTQGSVECLRMHQF